MVRFLTGRYLSEYASPEEVTYERNVLVDEKQVSIKITDVAGKVELLCHVHVYRAGTCCPIDPYCSKLKIIQKKKISNAISTNRHNCEIFIVKLREWR